MSLGTSSMGARPALESARAIPAWPSIVIITTSHSLGPELDINPILTLGPKFDFILILTFGPEVSVTPILTLDSEAAATPILTLDSDPAVTPILTLTLLLGPQGIVGTRTRLYMLPHGDQHG